MAASTTTSSSSGLASTVAHAITFLTQPLMRVYAPATIVKLQLVLEASLIAHYAPSWLPSQPSRGTGRRTLTLSPFGLPPRPIFSAMEAASVEWSTWIKALGGVEFDLVVDPGCVSVRYTTVGAPAKTFVVWSEQLAAEQAKKQERTALANKLRALADRSRTQQMLEAEDAFEADELFAALSAEVRAPTWHTPTSDRFPALSRLAIPVPSRKQAASPAVSAHSRSSSSSSFSFTSVSSYSPSSADSSDSETTVSSSDSSTAGSACSRRQRARQERVFVDATKTEVTPYDGGKTTVLTGGVMLGGGPKPAHRRTASSASAGSWRSARV